MTQVYEQTASDLFNVKARVVGPGLKTGMPIRYEDPREVGADRIVNAVAAYRKWQTGVIVVDFGTATTFDVVSTDGAYLGGVICPGIKRFLAKRYLIAQQNFRRLPSRDQRR